MSIFNIIHITHISKIAMKTAISIPDSVFNAAELVAKKLNISRSELFTKAVSDYLKHHQKNHVTEALDKIYGVEDSSIDSKILQMQSYSVEDETW
jgi:metal-responsive CopG/Arc/MetJ family transcriptional regulator